MYTQVEKPKENKSRAAASSVAQKKNSGQQCLELIDKRPEAALQLQMKEKADIYSTTLSQQKASVLLQNISAEREYSGNSFVVQRVKYGNLTLGILGTIFSVGLIWLSPGFRKVMSIAWQDDEYHEKLIKNDFRIKATLKNYQKAFGNGFTKELMSLGEDERWMDGGAGVGQAIKDYYAEEGKASVTAIGYEKPENEVVKELEQNKKFVYLSGKFFSEMDDRYELETEKKGKFKIITDYNGVLSYTKTLSQDLQKYLDNLNVGGKIYTIFYADIENEDDKMSWINMSEGINETLINGNIRIIEKTEKNATVKELELVTYSMSKSSNIPNRVFRVK